MATATNNVQVKVQFQGIDNSKKASRQATESIRRFGKSAKEATKDAEQFGKKFEESGERVSDTSGKASTALSSLSDFAGSSEGAFRTASEAAGLLDDVMTVLPGPIGIAAGAIAGLTTVLVLNRQEAERSAAKIRQAFSADLAAEVSQLRREFDLNADAAVELGKALEASGLSAQDVSKDLARVVREAEEIGRDGSEAVSDFAKTILNAGRPVDILTRKLRRLNLEASKRTFAELTADRKEGEQADQDAIKRLNTLTNTLKQQEKALKDLRAGRTGELANLKIHASFLQRVGNFISGNTELQKRATAAKLRDEQAEVDLRYRIQQTRDALKQFNEIRNQALESAAEAKRIREEEAKALAKREFQEANAAAKEYIREKQRQRNEKARQAAARARAAQARKQREIDRAARDAKREEDAAVQDALKYLDELDRKEQQVAREKQKKDEAERKRLKEISDARRAEFDKAISQITALQNQVGTLDSTVGNALAAIPALGASVAVAIEKGKDGVVEATNIASTAIQGFISAEQTRGNEQLKSEEQAALSTATTQEERTAIQKKFEERRAKNVEDAEKRKAAVMALVAAAQAAFLISQGKIPQAVAAGVAAAGFAAIAGGAVKRIGGAAATAGGGATTGAGAETTTTTADATRAGGNVVVNFGAGFVIGTQQQVGQAVAGSLRSLRTTGLATAGGV